MTIKIKSIQDKIKKNPFWKNLFTNSFWGLLGDGVTALMNLIIIILLINLIGNSGYGALILTQTYTQIMDILLNIQSWKSVIQYGQKAITKKDKRSLMGYIKTGCILDLSTAFLGGIISFLLASMIGNILNWNNEMIWCARIFSLTIFSHFSGTPTAILRISNKFNLVALQKIITAILKVSSFLVILLWKNSIKLINAVIVYSLMDIIGNLLLVLFAFFIYRKNYSIKETLKTKVPKDYKDFIRYTLWGTLNDVADIPINYFDVFIISFIANELVAVFKVFKQIVALLSKLTVPIYQAIMPQFSELYAQGFKKRGYEIVIKIRNLILMVIGPCALLLGLTSPFWLKVFFGQIYANNWYVLTIYLLFQTSALSYTTVHPYFISLGKTKQAAIYTFIANSIYIIISLLSVKFGGMLALVFCFFIQSSLVIGLKIYSIKKELLN